MGDRTLGGEFVVECPEGLLLAGVGHNGEVAVNKGKLGMRSVEVEGSRYDAVVKDDILDLHDRFDFFGNFFSSVTI